MQESENTTPARRPRVWPVLAALGWVFVAQAVGGALLILGQRLVLGVDLLAPIEVTPGLMVLLAAFPSLLFIVVSLAGGALSHAPMSERLRLGGVRPATLVLGVSVVGFTAQTQMLDSLLSLLPVSLESGTLVVLQAALQEASGASLLGAILFIGPMTGLGEELFFRGFVQTRLRERWGRWPAILAASAAFALYHFDPVHSTLAFVSGLLLGWMTEASGSLWPAVAAHATNNAVAVILTASIPEPTAALQFWLLFLTVPITLSAVALLMRTFREVGVGVPDGLS